MKTIHLFFFSICCCLFFSCENDDMKLSTHYLLFKKEGGTAMITSEKGCLIDEVIINGELVSKFDTINPIITTDEKLVITEIKTDWFVIKPITTTQCSVDVGNNDTGKERTIRLGFHLANFFDHVDIVQSAN